MSSAVCAQLTEEQRKFLESLEEEFKDRYTEKDEEFSAILNEEIPLPPVVEPRREFGQFDERRGQNRGDRDRYGHDRPSDRYRHDRLRDRYRHDDDDYYRHSHSSRYVDRYRDRNHSQNAYRPF